MISFKLLIIILIVFFCQNIVSCSYIGISNVEISTSYFDNVLHHGQHKGGNLGATNSVFLFGNQTSGKYCLI